jgi:hypothetical protein
MIRQPCPAHRPVDAATAALTPAAAPAPAQLPRRRVAAGTAALLIAGVVAAAVGVEPTRGRGEPGPHAGAGGVAGADATAAPATTRDPSPGNAEPTPPRPDLLPWSRLATRAPEPDPRDLFRTERPDTGSPPAARPAPDALRDAPAPTFPYAFIGALADQGRWTAFFSRGEQVLALREGDLVDGRLRVVRLDRRSMTLSALPDGATLDVALGAAP